ncbi:MAG: ABC transporter substrate-binding protein/permease [Lactobacillaceae bacterium]|jgi:polar amino acid transport system substrate-binding protein|nr:ABC transporter substrate-binding protein/permease [Lactobacillaceae bacterium]
MKIKLMKKVFTVIAISMMMVGSLVAELGAFSSVNAAEKTDPAWTKIKKSGQLVVGTSADYAPYEFHTNINGKDKIVGFDISMAQEIAKKLGVKLVVKDMSFDALLGAVTTGKVDMVIAGMTNTPERAEEVDFSIPYFSDNNVLMVRKADANKYNKLSDIKGHKVAAQVASTQYDDAEKINGAKVVALKKIPDMATQLTQKKLDGVVVASTTAESYVQQSPAFAIAQVSLGKAAGSSIVMPKNSPVLKAKVNKIIKKDVLGAPFKAWKAQAIKIMNKKEGFFQKYWPYFVQGTLYTLGLAAIGVFFGAVIGTLLALMKTSTVWVLKAIANVYIEFVRGTPLLIQVFIVFFGTQIIGLNVAGFLAGAIAMSLNSAAYVAEIIRSGINSIAEGQAEAARSLGLSKKQTMRFVVLPQAVKNILPALGNEFVTVIKEGSVVSVIGVGELTFQTSLVQGSSFKPFLPLMITALIYFVLTFGISRLLGLAERRMAQSERQI